MEVYGPYKAIVRDIHDGDTVGLDIDLGFAQSVLTKNAITGKRQMSCRLYQCFAPELNTDAGKLSLQYLLSILPLGAVVEVTSYGWDKYGGRFDGVIIFNEVNINEQMVAAGYATLTA